MSGTRTPLRPQVVSRVLAKAGFGRAESEVTSVRGYHRYVPGFEVQGAKAAWETGLASDRDEDAVYVTVQSIDSFGHLDKTPEQLVAEWVPGYVKALTEAGFHVETVTGWGERFRALRVTRSVGTGA